MQSNAIILDGAMGTCLWDRIGDNKPVWNYNVEHPDTVRELLEEYVTAGAQIISANTFGANAPAVAESTYSVEQIMREGVIIAKEAANNKAKVALDIGPLTELLEPYGDLEEDEALQIYEEQIGAGMCEHPDLIILQTFIDIEMLKIAAKVARKYSVPLLCSMSFGTVGKTIMGNSVEQMVKELAPFSPDAVGHNCTLTPQESLPVLEKFRECTDLPLFFKPNAGQPEYLENGEFSKANAEVYVNELMLAPLDRPIYIGGCCGTSPEFIELLAKRLHT